MSLTQSVASLQISGDLLEHFGLSELSPTDLHVAALYGIVTFLSHVQCAYMCLACVTMYMYV